MPMNLVELQQRVDSFVRAYDLQAPPEHRVLDLASEVGELAKEALRSAHYGSRPFTPTNAWRDEMGDVLFALICLANTSDVNLESVLLEAIYRLETRKKAGGPGDSAG